MQALKQNDEMSGSFSIAYETARLREPWSCNSAIENIVRNANRFTDEQAEVEVEIKSHERDGKATVQIIVLDFGPGLPDQELEMMFRPFYRANESRDRQSGGTGLGLAIAERVVQMHHGTIRAEDAQPIGLKVRVELPGATA